MSFTKKIISGIGKGFGYAGFAVATTFRALWAYKWGARVICILGAVLVVWGGFNGMAIFNVMGLNTYEQGWRAGNLSTYGVSNRMFQFLPPGSFLPTGEGYMLLGDNSSRGASMNGRQISPSYFSTNFQTYEDNIGMLGQPVAMHFRELIRRWSLNGLTDIRVDSFEKLVPTNLPKDCSESHGWLSKAYNNISGKVVEAAKIGNPLLWKTQEIIVYAGGNEFTELSIIDPRIFDCAVTALKSGQTVLISYDDRIIRDPITQNTTYNLVSIADQK